MRQSLQTKKSKLKVAKCLPFSSLPGLQQPFPTAADTLYTPQLHTTHTAQHANTIAHMAQPAHRAKHTHTTPCVSHDTHRQTRACNTRTLKSDLSELKDCRLSLRTVSPLNDSMLGGNHHRISETEDRGGRRAFFLFFSFELSAFGGDTPYPPRRFCIKGNIENYRLGYDHLGIAGSRKLSLMKKGYTAI